MHFFRRSFSLVLVTFCFPFLLHSQLGKEANFWYFGTNAGLELLISANAYQGCEHGCAYCYARPTHEYWGLSAGIDFERKILVKKDAPQLLEKKLRSRSWEPAPIMLSGNTDCYQPIEHKLKLTRQMLEVFLEFRNPVGIITKNALILRDLDLLKELAKKQLVHVMISITTLHEELRRVLEPRTSTSTNRLKAVQQLSSAGIPTGVMVAPVIPALNSDEIPLIIEHAAKQGAINAGYTIIRLNGTVEPVFKEWLQQNYPDRKQKILNHIKECHGGSTEDRRFGKRMSGEGNTAGMIKQLFDLSVKKYMRNRKGYPYNLELFRIPKKKNDQLDLFRDP